MISDAGLNLTTMDNESSFSIELKSRDRLRSISLNGSRDTGLLVQGSLGALQGVEFQENSVLVIIGTNGIFRLDLVPEEFYTFLKKGDKNNEK